jgi:enterobactin synthetase component D
MTLPVPTLLKKRLGIPKHVGFSTISFDALSSESRLPEIPDRLRSAAVARKRDYMAGRICARDALCEAGFPDDMFPDIGRDGLPVWPRSWMGSISHSGDYAVAVAVPQMINEVLAIDIQRVESFDLLRELQPLIARPAELARAERLDPATRLTLLFSGKETLYKALYPQVRTFQDFDAAEFVGISAQSLEFRLTCHWSSHWVAGTRIRVSYGCFGEYIVTCTY